MRVLNPFQYYVYLRCNLLGGLDDILYAAFYYMYDYTLLWVFQVQIVNSGKYCTFLLLMSA